MLAKECMTTKVQIGFPEMSLCEAAQIMKNCGLGILPISNAEKIVGILTDRDIAIRAVARSLDPISTLVSEIMSKEVIFCYDDQSIDEITHIITEKHLRRLPVLNHKQRLVGILTVKDIASGARRRQLKRKPD